MSVNIETTDTMSPSIDSLSTSTVMHRVWFEVNSPSAWYDIMREARSQFGKNWQAQPRFKRKIERERWSQRSLQTWFQVPSDAFGTWCALKLGCTVVRVEKAWPQ